MTLIVIIAVYASLSSVRNCVWEDELTLWRDVSGKSSFKARPHTNFSLVLYREGFFDDAMAEAQKSLKLYYYHPGAHYIIGLVSFRKGDIDTAIRAYQWAILTTTKYVGNPKYEAEIHNSLGLAYKAQGYYDLARIEFEEAIRLKSSFSEAKENLGNLLTP